MLKTKQKPKNAQEVLARYPRLTGHLICESLGYFTPEAAANGILSHINQKPFFCEWYIHLVGFNDAKVVITGMNELLYSFRHRHYHRGYMADYQQARRLVDHVRSGGPGPIGASWF